MSDRNPVGALQTLIGYVASGQVKVQVGHVLPLGQAAEAHRMLEERRTTGKIVLKPWATARWERDQIPCYMVVAAFTGEPDTDLLQAERERLKELADGGILRAVYLSADRSEAWLVIHADDPCAARNEMESLHPGPRIDRRVCSRPCSPTTEPGGDGTERSCDAGLAPKGARCCVL